MNRRGLLKGILAAGMAPAVVGSGILMPLGKVFQPFAFDLNAWNKRWEDVMLRQAELAANPPIYCAWNGRIWVAEGSVSLAKIYDPTSLMFCNDKALQK